MAEQREPMTFKIEPKKVSALRKLGQFDGMNFSDIMRELIDGALLGAKPELPLNAGPRFAQIGLVDAILDYKHHDFTHEIQNARRLYVCVKELTLFLQLYGHMRIFDRAHGEGLTTIIVLFEYPDSEERDDHFRDFDRLAFNRILKRGASDSTAPSSMSIVVRDSKKLDLPDFAILADESVYVSTRYDPSDDFPDSAKRFALKWLGDADTASEYLTIRQCLSYVMDTRHPRDVLIGPPYEPWE